MVNKSSLNCWSACLWIKKTKTKHTQCVSYRLWLCWQNRAVVQFSVEIPGCLTEWEVKNLGSETPCGPKLTKRSLSLGKRRGLFHHIFRPILAWVLEAVDVSPHPWRPCGESLLVLLLSLTLMNYTCGCVHLVATDQSGWQTAEQVVGPHEEGLACWILLLK